MEGYVLASLGRTTDAIASHDESRAHLEAALPSGHSDLCRAAQRTAQLYEAWSVAEPSVERVARAQEWRKKVQTAAIGHD